jgi:PAS domain S-box-containing protein
MKEPSRTNAELITEISALKQKIKELEQSESERKRASGELRQSEEYFKAIIKNASDIILVVDKLGTITYASPSIERFLGYGLDELIGKRTLDLIVSDDKPKAIADFGRALLTKEVPVPNVFRIRHKDGTERILEGIGKNLLDNPIVAGFVMNVRDITDRKQVENSLRESEERYRTILESIEDGYFEVDIAGHFTFFNDSVCRILGYTRAEMMGMNNRQYTDKENSQILYQAFNKVFRTGEPSTGVGYEIIRKDGTKRYIESSASLIRNVSNQPIGFRGIMRDITERKRAENALRESEQRYRELIDFLPISFFEVDAAGSITSFNRTALEVFRYNKEDYKEGMNALQFFAPEEWQRVGENMGEVIQGTSTPGQEFTFLRKDGSKFIGLIYASPNIHQNKTVGIRGAIVDITERKRAEEGLRVSEENFRRSLDQSPLGVRVVSTEGENLYVNRATLDIFGCDSIEEWQTIPTVKRYTEQSYAEFKARRERRRFDKDDSSEYEIDIVRKDGEVRHLYVWRARILWDGKEHYQLRYSDITESKRSEKQLKETLESLRKAVGTTIQVMVSAVETRDPYTSGHQIRSADLSRAIATEMGLPQEKIDGIRMAGSIHDIGKLSIPAEILSKPTKLSDIEFSLIKEHARQGYEILKNVESPWPLAETVYQHHERMDGSGYPRNLKGDEILMEARILAVSDVVESMATHRPYRPALGLNAALAEIENNKGTLYDAEAADACLRLFREKGFQLTTA